MAIKDKYDDLKKKYDLPEYSLMEYEFDLNTIDDEKQLLKEIRKKISDKMEYFTKLIEGVLQPDTNAICMHECKVFDDKNKDKIYGLFTKMMILHRNADLAFLNTTEKNDAEFIKSCMKEWPSLKKELTLFVQTLKDSWMNETELKEDLGYMG